MLDFTQIQNISRRIATGEWSVQDFNTFAHWHETQAAGEVLELQKQGYFIENYTRVNCEDGFEVLELSVTAPDGDSQTLTWVPKGISGYFQRTHNL